ncbi:hypothetical protein KAFR_0C04390 [Kazachstania africana CBS 2517]|uniref:Histidinol-phosphatase n=1 Tax=Kazachstania africana (strain ATCC 22294 / BCRC 22015 / CBS 2517 / CECT 1963 / NBRC 1671 / NRRL Y-8276) TaxID=1071382 RepID=H2ASS9_KAZAF|nr:hypothetical protein KAFR_0C04390 [Kazachstania africana CBS 2517]CCF57429.1 hypothetical protein KAFR_0C04390 [Kazachstania africana CBS 2517]
MHSHHSHSGDYVAHGADPLEDIVDRAKQLGFDTYCLTEHMPRFDKKYLYPEEIEGVGNEKAIDQLKQNFSRFLGHAKQIKTREKDNINIVIGTEIECCDIDHIEYARTIIKENRDTIKFTVGSIHHINEIPIDFDQLSWNRCLASFNNNLKDMLISYYELQFEMLQRVQPLVVGHFDLYKLYLPRNTRVDPLSGVVCENENSVVVSEFSLIEMWETVRNLVIRNLKYIKLYGGTVEINSSGLRKKLKEPYPGSDICQLVKKFCDGRFVLSDDSHAVAHVAVCYLQLREYIVDVLQLQNVYYISQEDPEDTVTVKSMSIDEFKNHKFWNNSMLSRCE